LMHSSHPLNYSSLSNMVYRCSLLLLRAFLTSFQFRIVPTQEFRLESRFCQLYLLIYKTNQVQALRHNQISQAQVKHVLVDCLVGHEQPSQMKSLVLLQEYFVIPFLAWYSKKLPPSQTIYPYFVRVNYYVLSLCNYKFKYMVALTFLS